MKLVSCQVKLAACTGTFFINVEASQVKRRLKPALEPSSLRFTSAKMLADNSARQHTAFTHSIILYLFDTNQRKQEFRQNCTDLTRLYVAILLIYFLFHMRIWFDLFSLLVAHICSLIETRHICASNTVSIYSLYKYFDRFIYHKSLSGTAHYILLNFLIRSYDACPSEFHRLLQTISINNFYAVFSI